MQRQSYGFILRSLRTWLSITCNESYTSLLIARSHNVSSPNKTTSDHLSDDDYCITSSGLTRAPSPTNCTTTSTAPHVNFHTGLELRKSRSRPHNMPSTTAHSTSSTSTCCRLLELPAELRNRIYREVLITGGCIDVTRESISQPPLLRACRQIRAEAKSIYYLENRTFYIDVPNFDPAIVLKFHEQASGYWNNSAVSLRSTSPLERSAIMS